MSGQETKQTPGFIDNGKCAEGEFFLFDEIQHIADFLIGMDFDGFSNQPVDMVFDPGNLGELLLGRHVVMDQSKAAMERKGDRHAGFGDCVHIGRDHGQVEVQAIGETGFVVRVLWQNLAVERGERHIVVGESQALAAKEEIVSRFVEKTIPISAAARPVRYRFHASYSGMRIFEASRFSKWEKL